MVAWRSHTGTRPGRPSPAAPCRARGRWSLVPAPTGVRARTRRRAPADRGAGWPATGARGCLAWLLEAPGVFPVEYRAPLGDRIYGCDDCQTACPPNRAADRRAPGAACAVEPDEQPWVDVVELLELDDSEIIRRQ